MQESDFDPMVLRRSMLGAMDIITAHLMCKERVVDLGRTTSLRETLEERLVLALEEIDLESMPAQWSLENAAMAISSEIALQMIFELSPDRDAKY